MRRILFAAVLLMALAAPSFASVWGSYTNQGNWDYLDNGVVKVGFYLPYGAAISYISLSGGSTNMVQYPPDDGGVFQQAYFGTPVGEEDIALCGWNPTQAGDGQFEPAGAASEIVTNGTTSWYSKSVPFQFTGDAPACDNNYSLGQRLPIDGYMEQWVTLEGELVHVHYKFTYTGDIDRSPDANDYDQENGIWGQAAPGAYMAGNLDRIIYYTGTAPWTGGTLTDVRSIDPESFSPGTEKWAAAFPDNNPSAGVGVYTPTATGYGIIRVGTWSTYLVPWTGYNFRPRSTYEFDTYVTLGDAATIRSRFAAIRDDGVVSRFLPGDVSGSSPDKSFKLVYEGVAGATAYRVYKNGNRWPDASTEFSGVSMLDITGYADGDVIGVSAVVDGVEGAIATWHLDTTPPSTTSNRPSGAYLEETTITLSAGSDASDPVVIEYRWDGGAWQTYSEPLTVQAGTLEWQGHDSAEPPNYETTIHAGTYTVSNNDITDINGNLLTLTDINDNPLTIGPAQ